MSILSDFVNRTGAYTAPVDSKLDDSIIMEDTAMGWLSDALDSVVDTVVEVAPVALQLAQQTGFLGMPPAPAPAPVSPTVSNMYNSQIPTMQVRPVTADGVGGGGVVPVPVNQSFFSKFKMPIMIGGGLIAGIGIILMMKK